MRRVGQPSINEQIDLPKTESPELGDPPSVHDFTEIEEIKPGFYLRVLSHSGGKCTVGKYDTRKEAERVELAIIQMAVEFRTKRNAWEQQLKDAQIANNPGIGR